MKSISLMNFSEALNEAKNNTENPIIMRFKDAVVKDGKIDLEASTYYWIGENKSVTKGSKEKGNLCICSHSMNSMEMRMENKYNVFVAGGAILADDFISVKDWEFIGGVQ